MEEKPGRDDEKDGPGETYLTEHPRATSSQAAGPALGRNAGQLRPKRLVIHELAHEFRGHIGEAYYEGLSTLGAKLALCDPQEILGERTASTCQEAKG